LYVRASKKTELTKALIEMKNGLEKKIMSLPNNRGYKRTGTQLKNGIE
jgi:hypothetical protein